MQTLRKGILNITEVDGSPSVFPYKLIVTNGVLTDNGNGTVTLSIATVSYVNSLMEESKRYALMVS